MPTVEVALQVRKPDGTLAPLGADATSVLLVNDEGSRARLDALLAALTGTLSAVISGEVSLAPATLAALESVNALVSGTVELGATTLAALENVTATVSGTTDLPSATITALRQVEALVTNTVDVRVVSMPAPPSPQVVTGTVDIDDATPIRVQQIGAAGVADVQLPPGQVADLKRILTHDGNSVASDAKLEEVRRRLFGYAEAGVAPGVLHEILTRLSDIFGAVDGLEITAGNIDISNTSIGLSVDELEAIMRSVRDRVDFPLPAAQAALLTSLNTVLSQRLPRNVYQYASGFYRTGGFRELVTNTAPSVEVRLLNPAGSGVRITITAFLASSGVTPVDIHIFKDRVRNGNGSPITPFAPNRVYEAYGPVTSAAELVYALGTSIFSGGTLVPVYFRIPTGALHHQEYVSTIDPGQSLSLRMTQVGVTTSENSVGMNVTWIEEPIA